MTRNSPVALHKITRVTEDTSENLNDNRLPAYDNSKVTVVQDQAGLQTILRLSNNMMSQLKLGRGKYVNIISCSFVDPFYLKEVNGYQLLPSNENCPGAVRVSQETSKRVLIRKRGLDHSVMSAKHFYVLDSERKLIAPVDINAAKGLSELKSINSDPNWWGRRLFLAGFATGRKTTPAGDECYTARFFADIILNSAGRRDFDVDVCSMSKDGNYTRNIQDYSQIQSNWGKTPLQFRKPEAVLGSIPAKQYMINDRPGGSLAREWSGDFIWCNPPYSNRIWVSFLEKAHIEVSEGRAGIVVALVPADNNGEHVKYMFDENAYRIELTAHVPFYKSKPKKIDVIRGSQLVVFGRGSKVKKFLWELIIGLMISGYITREQAQRHHRDFCR